MRPVLIEFGVHLGKESLASVAAAFLGGLECILLMSSHADGRGP